MDTEKVFKRAQSEKEKEQRTLLGLWDHWGAWADEWAKTERKTEENEEDRKELSVESNLMQQSWGRQLQNKIKNKQHMRILLRMFNFFEENCPMTVEIKNKAFRKYNELEAKKCEK